MPHATNKVQEVEAAVLSFAAAADGDETTFGYLPSILFPNGPPLFSERHVLLRVLQIVVIHMGVVPLFATRWWPVFFIFVPLMVGVYAFSYTCIFCGFFGDLPDSALAMAPPMMSWDGISAMIRFSAGGASEYPHNSMGMVILCITSNLLYWPFLIAINCDCRIPTKVGWFTRWWLKHGFFGKTADELEMGAIGIYQATYMALNNLNFVSICAASRVPFWYIEGPGWRWWRMLVITIQYSMLILNKWAFCLIGLNTVCWVDMFCRRKLCPFVQHFPFNVCNHPMLWSGAMSYYLMQVTGHGGVSLYGILHVTINSLGNYVYVRYFEQPFIKWFFVDKMLKSLHNHEHNGNKSMEEKDETEDRDISMSDGKVECTVDHT